METATEASPDDASPADDADVYDVVLFYAYTSIAVSYTHLTLPTKA